MIRYTFAAFLTLFLLCFSVQAQTPDTTKKVFRVEVSNTGPYRHHTVHYNGSQDSPIGIGYFNTKKGEYGIKLGFRSFINDDVVTGDFSLQQNQSGVEVIFLPGSSVNASPAAVTENVSGTDDQSLKRVFTFGLTRGFDEFSIFLESGFTRSRNYQAFETDVGTAYREHPEGFKTTHLNVGGGIIVNQINPFSLILGYNFTKGALPDNHEFQFGFGYTFP